MMRLIQVASQNATKNALRKRNPYRTVYPTQIFWLRKKGGTWHFLAMNQIVLANRHVYSVKFTKNGSVTHSTLVIAKATADEAGTYRCTPHQSGNDGDKDAQDHLLVVNKG